MNEGILIGLNTAFSGYNIIMVMMGCFAGTIIGMLPGLGPMSAIALMIPITYGFDPASAMILMAGVYYGAIFGGSTSSILINAPGVAEKLGITVSETRPTDETEFTELIEIETSNDSETSSISGTFYGSAPRIVIINGHRVEADPVGHVLLVSNTDKPGVVGAIGEVLANHKANIATMSLSRNQVGDLALTVLNLDAHLDQSARDELLSHDTIHSAKLVTL